MAKTTIYLKMKKYQVRFNCITEYINFENIVRAKVVFKTKETDWIHTEKNSIVLVSIDSVIHEEIHGDLKMDALMKTIRENTRGKVAILLADTAHIHTQSIGESRSTLKRLAQSTASLKSRYVKYFQDSLILHWSYSIQQHEHYKKALLKIENLYQKDPTFRDLIQKDAETTYTQTRSIFYPDKTLFIEKAIEDLLDQCACILILSKLGYRYQFYPGNCFQSTQYVNQALLDVSEKIDWISVFLAIERKTLVPKEERAQSG